MTTKQKVIGVFVLIVIISFSIFHMVTSRGVPVRSGTVYVREIDVRGASIKLSGDVVDSALIYKDFNYVRENNDLYIQLNYNHKRGKDKSGTFLVEIEDDFTMLEKIYIMGVDKSETTLVWNGGR